MSVERGTPAGNYYPGDEISLGVAFSSDAKITSVEVVYTHPLHRWIMLALEGSAEPMGGGPISAPEKRHVVAVSGVVEEHHAPGIHSW